MMLGGLAAAALVTPSSGGAETESATASAVRQIRSQRVRRGAALDADAIVHFLSVTVRRSS